MTRTSRTDPGSKPAANGGNPPTAGDSTAADLTWLPREEDERVRWQGRPRIQTVLPWVALAVIGTIGILTGVVLELLPVLAAVGVPLVGVPALWQYARVSRAAFVVTNAVAATRHGVFGLTVRTVSIERIQNTTVEQQPLGRLVGYGTVTLETASGTELSFWNVEEPTRVRERLEAERERLTGTEVPGSRDQWEAVLAEVREWRRVLERNP
ncbi:PH domain-containing protein [Natrinema gelatinilyticum]|uniref:PH domain-containing protein n=1 Tax=Natrinema gelatinilyticum TaxID=2961571 RepID=UPI0020C39FA6|nr:PH domain-containing protein [Natrinema gelatinilyticum]